VNDDHVVVITDSAASLPSEEVARQGIVVVPLTLVVEGLPRADEPLGDVALDGARANSHRLTTASPSPGAFVSAVQEHRSAGGALIATVSATMSATHAAALNASRYFPEGTVEVVDTGSAAGGEGLVVLAAASAARSGAPLEQVARRAAQVARRIRLLATLPDLEHLARSGRVPMLAARARRLVGLHPIFEFRDGRPVIMRPAMTRKAALRRMIRVCLRDAGGDRSLRPVLHAAVLHAGVPDEAAGLRDRLLEALQGADHEIFLAPFSSVMVAHTGEGLIGIAWWWETGSAPSRRLGHRRSRTGTWT